MLKLKKKGEKLILDSKALNDAYGGHNCGQGCSDSCGTGADNYEQRRTDHHKWKMTPWPVES